MLYNMESYITRRRPQTFDFYSIEISLIEETPEWCVADGSVRFFYKNQEYSYSGSGDREKDAPTYDEGIYRISGEPFIGKFEFTKKQKVECGNAIYVVGSLDLVGNWDPLKAIRLEFKQDDNWKIEIEYNLKKDFLRNAWNINIL